MKNDHCNGQELLAAKLQVSSQEDDDRGSGRILHFAKSRNVQPDDDKDTSPYPLKLILTGSRQDVIGEIKFLHLLQYAEVTAWSRLQRGLKPGEVMSILALRTSHMQTEKT
jgi:hypothetical protein